jgi:spoIIIJ-associated protein
MALKVTFVIENEELALDEAEARLKLPQEKISLKRIRRFQEDGITKYEYEASNNLNLGLEGTNYLRDIFDVLKLNVLLEFSNIDDDTIKFRLHPLDKAKVKTQNGNESRLENLLIGRNGQNLRSFEILIKTYLERFTLANKNFKVTLDIGNYHDNREHRLELTAISAAKEVLKTKQSIRLDPMNSFERRLVHEALQRYAGQLSSDSEGEGQQRAIVIKYLKSE